MAENRELALVLKLVADQFQSELRKQQGALSSFNSFIRDWKTQLTAAGTALFAIAKSTANYGAALKDTSERIGISVPAFAALQHAAATSDLSIQQLGQGLRVLSQRLVEAAQGTGMGETMFRHLGVSATDAAGKIRPTEAVLLDLAEVFARSADGAGKVDAAMKLFGKSGVDLVPLLNKGKAGITELMAEAQRLGLVMSRENAEAASRFNYELTRLQGAMRGLTLQAGTPLLGVLSELTEAFTSLMSGGAVSWFFKGLAEQMVLFSTLVKEAAANVQFLFGKFTWEQLGTEIQRLEAEAQAKLLLLENPAAAPFVSGPAGGRDGAKPQMGELADQEKLGKALIDIFQQQYRSIEIRNKQVREGLNSEYLLRLDRQAQLKKIDEDAEVAHGQRIVERTTLEVRLREAAAAKERETLSENATAWLAYHEQVGGSSALRAEHEVALLKATLAQQLNLTTEAAGRLLQAWHAHDAEVAEQILSTTALTATERETIELQMLTRLEQAHERTSDNVFDGWVAGLRRYVREQQSMFGFGADMARRFFQTMEQSSQRLFFDTLAGRIQSTKDLFAGLLNFAQQITSQIASQLLTKQIGQAITGMGGGGAGTVFSALMGGMSWEGATGAARAAARGAANPTLFGPGFAKGGSFRVPGSGGTDSMPVGFWATPGETVDVRTPSQQTGGVSVIVNNYSQAQVEAQPGGRDADGKQLVYVTVREAVKKAFASGAMDKTMQGRFRLHPRAGG